MLFGGHIQCSCAVYACLLNCNSTARSLPRIGIRLYPYYYTDRRNKKQMLIFHIIPILVPWLRLKTVSDDVVDDERHGIGFL